MRTLALLRRLRGADRGSVAVETAIVMPLVLALMLGAAELSMYFLLENQATQVAFDTARRLAVGDLSVQGASAYIEDRLSSWDLTYQIDASENGSDVSVSIAADLRSSAYFTLSGLFPGHDLSVASVFRKQF